MRGEYGVLLDDGSVAPAAGPAAAAASAAALGKQMCRRDQDGAWRVIAAPAPGPLAFRLPTGCVWTRHATLRRHERANEALCERCLAWRRAYFRQRRARAAA